MAKTDTILRCKNCDTEYPKWQGKCDSCDTWNSLVEVRVEKKAGITRSKSKSNAIPLRKVEQETLRILDPKLEELKQVLGKGFILGSAVLIGGEPGIGKSTLALQVAQIIAAQGEKVLYISGEESLPQ